ncbi:hypothetical protein A8C56_06260 [Niabella ginsenosidivorans]|uniref:Right handed beta helix domain-containing protein n=1 Tax=Niabella ginsenosidivorans TaxID=1176587 RepID=A0A1A9HZ07_9BACT|nr:right-handed parallel beta-helix repeat-containing protein [Niabella ginsenosidivorans]ANH80638.1 hypothetical protein A8C56_06260 [Niabella ginsenosidivorans]
MNCFVQTVISLFLGVFCTSCAVLSQNTLELYLSPGGADNNPGTITQPLLTFGAALDKAARSKQQDITIYLRGGAYKFDAPVRINDPNWGSGKSLTISGFGNEAAQLSGTEFINAAAITATGKNSAGTLDVYSIPPDRYPGLFHPLTERGFGWPLKKQSTQLYIDDKPLTLTQWPATGKMNVDSVISAGDRHDKSSALPEFIYTGGDHFRLFGSEAGNLWVEGILNYGWAKEFLPVRQLNTGNRIIVLDTTAVYGVSSSYKNGKGTRSGFDQEKIRGFKICNVPDFSGIPFTWYFDKKSNRIYFSVPANYNIKKIAYTKFSDPFFLLENAGNITIKNLAVSNTLGNGIEVKKCHHIQLSKLNISQTGLRGVDVQSSDGVKIDHTIIANTGADGIYLSGGDLRTLSSCNYIVSGCDISGFSRLYYCNTPGISLNTVGAVVENCFIHDAPDQAILISGNNNAIQKTHIRSVCYDFSDIGAIYSGRNPSNLGNTVKENLFEDITGKNSSQFVAAVYIDDGSCGFLIGNNVFVACGTPVKDKENGFGAIHINGGFNNKIEANTFINCDRLLSGGVWDIKKWNSFLASGDIKQKLFMKTDQNSRQLYKTQYGALLDSSISDNSSMPRNNFVSNNSFINARQIDFNSSYRFSGNAKNSLLSISGNKKLTAEKIKMVKPLLSRNAMNILKSAYPF